SHPLRRVGSMTDSPTDHLAPQLTAIATTMRLIEEAQATLAEQKEQLAHAIVGLAASDHLTPDQRVALIRDLYWEHPEVKVKYIVPLVGNTRPVPDVAGPYQMRCGGCDAPVPARTRSDLANQRQWASPQCDECWLKQAEAEEQAWPATAHPAAWSLNAGSDHRVRADGALVTLDMGDAQLLFAMATAGKDDSTEAGRARRTVESARGGRVDAPADLVSWAVDEATRLLEANELGVVARVRASGLFERCTPSSLRSWLDRIEAHLWASAPASGW
ncbi:MAG TPA: hypothetical protein VMY34_02655, partial [Acidimicrobiales bacterium]|nr:hypothetical protein [Acidimicrobiales bacterium]